MVEAWVLPSVLEGLGLLAAGWTGARLIALYRLAKDPRLGRLASFFILAADAALIHLVAVFALELQGGVAEREGFEILDLVFWLYHASLLVALVAGVMALAPPRNVLPVLAPVLLLAEPILRILEAAGFAFLATRTVLNHLRRTNIGSLQVALGFAFLLLAQALFLFNGGEGPDPLGARDPWGEALALLGFVVLALTVPRGRLPSA